MSRELLAAALPLIRSSFRISLCNTLDMAKPSYSGTAGSGKRRHSLFKGLDLPLTSLTPRYAKKVHCHLSWKLIFPQAVNTIINFNTYIAGKYKPKRSTFYSGLFSVETLLQFGKPISPPSSTLGTA
jgi:hypothetical protein